MRNLTMYQNLEVYSSFSNHYLHDSNAMTVVCHGRTHNAPHLPSKFLLPPNLPTTTSKRKGRNLRQRFVSVPRVCSDAEQTYKESTYKLLCSSTKHSRRRPDNKITEVRSEWRWHSGGLVEKNKKNIWIIMSNKYPQCRQPPASGEQWLHDSFQDTWGAREKSVMSCIVFSMTWRMNSTLQQNL